MNKATLALGATSIIDRQLDALRETVAHIFVVGTQSEAWSARQLTVVPDDLPGHGALGGIYTAIVQLADAIGHWCSRATCRSSRPRFCGGWLTKTLMW